MISSGPVILMSQETKYSLTSEYLGYTASGESQQIQNPYSGHEQQLQSNPSQVNLNTFDVRPLYQSQTSNPEHLQLHLQHTNSSINLYPESQQSLDTMISEFSLMHDQQVDLLNQRRIRDRLERRSGSISSSFALARNNSRNLNSSVNNCMKISPSSSPSSSSTTTCFMTGNQVVLGVNSSSSPHIISSLAPPTTGHQSPLSSSSHHTPPDSPITDLCHTLASSSSSNPVTGMTLGNGNNQIPECNTMSPETHHQPTSYVTSTNGSNDRRPRQYSISGQVTSSSRGQQLTISSSQSPLASSSSSHIQEASSTGPFLRIIEQPTNRIRYRYKSEKGSHGGLTGEYNSQSKKTYPTVKLENYKFDPNVNIMIKASLVTNEEHPKPHVHKLMGRNCTPEGTCILPLSENYTASFQNLGILFIGKKEVPDILYQRKLNESRTDRSAYFLDEEESVPDDPLIDLEKSRLREEAEREAKDMNLNCVKLSFQAFDCTIDPNSSGNQLTLQGVTQPQITQINFPITTPVFSRPVANQKSPDSGELKIVRMDKSSGSTLGDEEVFLLCEKVNKKEIKVRFFEPDGEGNTIWESFGNFSESDVHHQVAIVFRTPAYRQVDINSLANVYLQLYRPKDGEYSEPRQFTYYPRSSYSSAPPEQFFHSRVESNNKRRKLMSYHSSPALGQQQLQSPNQRCPNVNISTLAQSYLPHQQQQESTMNGQQQQMQQSMETGLSSISHQQSPTSTSSPGSVGPNQMSAFFHT